MLFFNRREQVDKSLGTRILFLVAGGSLLLAIVLALIAHVSYRSYYVDVLAYRASSFAERILAQEPEFWKTYQKAPGQFSERMQSLITYEPNTGLYLIGLDGKVLATASEGRNYWAGSYRIDLVTLKLAAESSHESAVFGSDPDVPEGSCVVAARAVMYDGQQQAWLYVVARNAGASPELPGLVTSYAVKGAVKIALITTALGLLVTIGVLSLVARPLAGLTKAAEEIGADALNACSETEQRQGARQFQTNLPFTERDDEIGRLSRSLQSMLTRLGEQAQALIRTDSARRNMVAGVSHDLRTPLTALTSQLETLRIKRDTLSPDEFDRHLVGAIKNAQHMRRLTESLADSAKFDSPDLKAEVEPIDLGDLIEDMGMRYAERAQHARVNLELDYPSGMGLVNADLQLVERALANLIDNSLRVLQTQEKSGTIKILAQPTVDSIEIAVADNGPGIAQADRLRLFEAFYQTSAHREHRGSAGLGLSLVKRIAQLHGSDVSLDTEVGIGTKIGFNLKRQPVIA
jgi:signal transduction histidine kinase